MWVNVALQVMACKVNIAVKRLDPLIFSWSFYLTVSDRDRYTNEQIEKLTKEAIKNMGHQNHRQKVKYVETLKQENIALHKVGFSAPTFLYVRVYAISC